MALQLGTRVGVCEIAAQIGAGGMGEVYRATDTNLKRAVAVKVLPESVATDRDRLARFQREAEVLASLNHPNIAAIYGLERSNDITALVMELVEGPTLADRISRGPIPVEESLAIAKQIAEALEAAHEQGIIHRDLKPANIKLRPDGTVKVLDFGLAKALEPMAATGIDATASPTITSPAMRTGVGMLLGTAAYMSPEQARGKAVDKRSDIWAFGCVLYEMLTGSRAFEGDDVSDTLASVLKTQPNWQALPHGTPATVVRMLRRCLAKDAKSRLGDLSIVRIEINELQTGAVGEAETVQAAPKPDGARYRIWALCAAAAAGALVSAILVSLLTARPTAVSVRRFTIPIPTSADLARGDDISGIALSPDGRTLVLSRAGVGLIKRSLDGLSFEPVRGAEGGSAPFFSPDGAWIGFVAQGRLRKVPVGGGLVTTVSDVQVGVSRATWGDDGSIVVASEGNLYRVSSSGGTPEVLLKVERDYFQPRSVPGTSVVLVWARNPDRIEAIDLATRTFHPLVEGTSPQIAATGDLVFEQGGGIWAAKFDSKQLAIVGAPVRVTESVRVTTIARQALFSTASDGSLVYISGDTVLPRSLVWVDRTGNTVAAVKAEGEFQSPRLSPDGRRAVVSVSDGSRLDLWSYEFERGTRLRLTTQGSNRRTVWSPDGAQIAFYSTPEQGGDQDIYVMPSDGGEPKRLLARPGLQFPDTWSPDGRVLIFEDGEGGSGARRDLWVLPLDGAPKPLLVTPFNERGAVFSPDGRWLALVTDESGRSEIYVQPFPGPGTRVAISTNGGLQPMWSRDGRELFYREGDWLMGVTIQLDPLRISAPRKLFELPALNYNLDSNFADYDVARDGRFLAIRNDSLAPTEIHVVLNWTEELKRLVPVN